MKTPQLEKVKFPECWINCGYAMDAAIHTCQAVCPEKIDRYHKETAIVLMPVYEKGRLIAVHRMEWRQEKPNNFPCMVCRGGQGEFKVTIAKGLVTVRAVICKVCAKNPDGVVEYFLGEIGIGKNSQAGVVEIDIEPNIDKIHKDYKDLIRSAMELVSVTHKDLKNIILDDSLVAAIEDLRHELSAIGET